MLYYLCCTVQHLQSFQQCLQRNQLYPDHCWDQSCHIVWKRENEPQCCFLVFWEWGQDPLNWENKCINSQNWENFQKIFQRFPDAKEFYLIALCFFKDKIVKDFNVKLNFINKKFS